MSLGSSWYLAEENGSEVRTKMCSTSKAYVSDPAEKILKKLRWIELANWNEILVYQLRYTRISYTMSGGVRNHITPHTVLKESGALRSRLYLTHIDRLTSARNCVMLGYSEVWDRGGGAHYPLKIWSPFIFGHIRVMKARLGFGPVESLDPKLCHVGHLEAWGSCLGYG